MRFWIGFGASLLFATALAGQTALSHSETILVKTCLGTAEPASSPVEPSGNLAIAVFADTLHDDELAKVRQEISAFYQASPQTSLRVAAINGSEIQFAGPFRTRALLQTGLAELLQAAPASTVVPLHLYSYLGNLASQFGSGWSSLVLVGRFPATDPEMNGFTQAWLSTQFRSTKLRVSYWTPSGENADILDAVAPATGGLRLAEGLTPLVSILKSAGEFREISWPNPQPAAGFRVCPVTLVGANGQTVMTIPFIAAAAGAVVPELERYALLREKIKSLAAALAAARLSAEQANQVETDLNLALEINPREEETLRLGAGFYKRGGNDAKLAALLDVLASVAPNEPGVFADLGHSRFRMKEWDAAERALARARELKPGDALIAEELARIRMTSQDDRGALPFLEESLAANAGNQELWLLRADLAARLNDWQRTADSVEHAIALGRVPLTRRTALVRLYIEHQMPDRALLHVRAVTENLPADGAVRTEYAGFLDQLQQPEEALAAWKRTLEVDSKLELAHYRVTRLLIGKEALDQALVASEAGIEAAPQSARLYLAKVEVLEKKDRFYEARRTLRQISATLPDPALLEHLAELEDAGGQHAAHYYRQLVEAGNQSPALQARGLEAALRDGDQEDAAWFQARQTGGAGSGTTRARAGTVPIPGGLAALSFIARSRPSSPERFLVEYARSSARNLAVSEKKAAEAYTESIREHFRRVAELSALGTAKSGTITVTIAAQDKKNQKSAEKVLDLLGWKMRTGKQGVKLEPAEKGSRASHQETASALAIDEVGMQEALEAGKPFSFEIPVESASVALGEDAWRNQFYTKEKYPGGLAEAIASDLRLAETYAALGQMDANTASVLVSAVPLKTLAEKYSTMLLQYSSALAVERGRAAVPGGEAAETIWTNLAGANPRQPGPFFRALLAKEDGKLLAYYSALSELDIQHQRFFTRTASRTGKFYELFKDAPETQRSKSRHIQPGTFVEFLSEVPLDTDGSVDFPGSPEVWMVAKGQSHSTGNVAKMMKKLKRAVAPDVEDEILLRLAGTRYKESKTERSELDNFLAVMRIDEHRSDPLDEASALLLAQHYVEEGAAYPFFATLTGLGEKQFTQFFALTEEWRAASEAEKNTRLASLNALVKILCLAQQAGTLDEAQAATLFGKVMDGLQRAASPGARTAASLDLVREILAAAKNSGASPDEAMRNLLLGSAVPEREAAYSQVLELQKVPALETVMALADGARNLALGKGSPAEQIQVLETRASGLPVVEAPKEMGLKGKERQAVEGFQARRLPEIVKQFREKTAKKKVNPKDLEKLAQDYLEEIDAPVRWALEGVVYAYFFSPDDLLVSEDPLLLRKHQFVPLEEGKKAAHLFEPADLKQTSERAGSYFTGGFADFGDPAGLAAALSSKLGGDTGGIVAAKQISALRSTHWEQLREDDLRLLSLKVTVAREWIVRSASQPDLAAGLAESALGLLSLTRRADLLGALADGNWSSAWSLVTLSDLYFLGDRYLERYSKDPWQSPATLALRRLIARDDGARLQWLGAEFDDTLGCSHPHLHSAPPYEQYEKDLFPTRLAERAAEFKLYLARYADIAGMPASDLGTMAEPAARAILKKMQLSDLHDWRSALAAFAGLNDKIAEEALAKR